MRSKKNELPEVGKKTLELKKRFYKENELSMKFIKQGPPA